jgi:hypothetical protein
MRLVAVVALLALVVWIVVPARLRAAVWVGAILAGVVPWTDYQEHSHWAQVGWWPFVSPPVRVRDIVVNFLLYVPLGLSLTREHGWRASAAMTAGLALSVATEFSQVFSHTRFATMTDVVVNSLGTAAGALAGRLLTGRPPVS